MRKILSLCLFCLCLFSSCAHAYDHEYHGTIQPDTDTAQLLAYYVNEFQPEELTLTVMGEPDATGRYSDLYMDITGVKIEGVRLDKLTFRMYNVQFNEPINWAKGEVDCKDALQIYAFARLLQEDINAALAGDTFGDDDHWSSVSLAIEPSGLQGKGYYNAKLGFISLDILIEIASKLKLVNNKELWLDNPEVKINRLDLPEYITNKALAQIQPLLTLERFPLPLSLHQVNLSKGIAELRTRKLPEPLEQGITYYYTVK